MVQVLQDYRIGGLIRYHIAASSGDRLMMLPDEIRTCASFLAYRLADGSISLAGSAFFLARKITDTLHMQYVVTAKHVLDRIQGFGIESVLVSVNQKRGPSVWVELPIRDWHAHPGDASIDACVAHFGMPDGADQKYYPLESSVSKGLIAEEQIGPGEDVFVVGLFLHHAGANRSLPVVRVGNIAAMPEEKVNTRIGPMEAYLIECRSTSGLSGSPVFLHQGLVRQIGGEVKFAQTKTAGGFSYLMGLVHGHFHHKQGDVDAITGIGADIINAGIAIVVPIWNVVEIIEQPAVRQKDEELIRERQRYFLPKMD
jgi:hypothetical protein